MRKTLALVLSIVMVLSLAVVGVSAADATEIKTAAEFAAMAADGNYKLGADITIDASWGDTETTFVGTFDGDGHTVTISAPMFVKFGGVIKNLTIKGSASKDGTANEVASYCGAIANNIPKTEGHTVVFENITNNANITGVYRIGGLIGQASSGSTITFTNCVNNGTINGGNMVGGLVGYSQNNEITMTNCVNNGKVFVDVSRELTGLAAGIIGRFGADTSFQVSSASHITIVNCLNNGEVTGTSQAAGFLAHARNAIVTITNCTNKGNITSTYTASNDGTSDAGGFFGSTGGEKGYYCMVNISK